MTNKTFTLYWRTGQREVVTGNTVEEAFTLAGYGAGAAPALDFHAKGDDDAYVWDPAIGLWYHRENDPWKGTS